MSTGGLPVDVSDLTSEEENGSDSEWEEPQRKRPTRTRVTNRTRVSKFKKAEAENEQLRAELQQLQAEVDEARHEASRLVDKREEDAARLLKLQRALANIMKDATTQLLFYQPVSDSDPGQVEYPCSHFHEKKIMVRLLAEGRPCPICRRAFSGGYKPAPREMVETIEAYVESLPLQEQAAYHLGNPYLDPAEKMQRATVSLAGSSVFGAARDQASAMQECVRIFTNSLHNLTTQSDNTISTELRNAYQEIWQELGAQLQRSTIESAGMAHHAASD